MTTLTATTWGIGGHAFLWGYGAVALATALGIWYRWHRVLGPPQPDGEKRPDLGLYELAMLSGGSQLAITTAATQLHRDGLLAIGPDATTLEVAGELDPTADELERAVFETISRNAAMTAGALRAELAKSVPVLAMKAELTSSGLLLDDARVASLRWLWVAGALLAAAGVAQILAGISDDEPVTWLIFMVEGVVNATFWLFRRRPQATRRGRDVVDDWRSECDQLRSHPVAAESPLTAALFGGAALWLADPAIASALGVPREDALSWSGTGNGAACSASGDGCGGAGCGGGGCGGGD
jgi:uncharacterized protein (TIGR04222 family)